MKPKICLVADVPGWAFDNVAQKIKKELSYKYDIRIAYFNRREEANYLYEFIEKNNDCDWLHFLNRRILLLLKSKEFKEKVLKQGIKFEDYIVSLKKKCSTAVVDFIDIDKDGIENHKDIFNSFTSKYYTSNKKLFDIYNLLKGVKKPNSMIYDICDEKIFKPINLDRFKIDNIKSRELVIGWVGNSVHSDQGSVDLKGFNSILTPVVKELIDCGYKIKGYYADRNIIWRKIKEMPSYYSEIDLCVCTSIHEGTPMPILEAMNCGVPIISTDVGIVSEVFGPLQKNFIITDRKNGLNDEETRASLKDKIIYLYDNRELFESLSKENLKSIIPFDGDNTIRKFDKFFEDCLKSI